MIPSRAALATLLVLHAPWIEAAGSHTVTIGATVLSVGNCRFDTAGPTALTFAPIDPSSLANATVSANIGYRCTGGGALPNLTWSISSNDGQYETGAGAPRMRHLVDPTRFLPYSLNVPASATVPKNTNLNFTVVATIQVADFQNAIAGTYTDSVVLTIAP
jgi:spore coat protein U-like protein